MMTLTPRRRLRRLGLVAALTAAFGTALATPALAHTRLVGSTPGKDASAASVTEVELVFSDTIGFAKVLVKDAEGKEFQDGAARRDGVKVTQRLNGPLPAGRYSVAYAVVGEDGHRIEKSDLSFTATAGTGDAAAGGGAGQTTVGPAEPKRDVSAAHTHPAKADEDGGSSGASAWIMIGVGLLIGVGIGVAIVARAKRKAGGGPPRPAAGAGAGKGPDAAKGEGPADDGGTGR
ncbi:MULTISPECIES: copper resistance CopC family protein [Actinomadura]|uniref:Copper resistance protein CopC n=1 Tax=Actinomadura yumaensis TaxID=111807 RepID=A0ABW2CHR0_9ACTN|nr:copper resistance protein CopC [Actinomadura sp. J1-007]MWK32987.1 hypothetical protein [Actinomadura sp. J1-007]